MPLSDQQLEVIKQQRLGLNDAIEKNKMYRGTRVAHAYSINADFHATILTISLGLGSAIVPLLLLSANDLGASNSLYLTIASILLISNATYLTLVLKHRTETLSTDASSTGLKDTVEMTKLRNLLTKALVTKDEQYFIEYNTRSRSLAEDGVKDMQNGKWYSLNYSTDICVSLLVTAAIFVLRPIVAIGDTAYFSISAIVLTSLIWWFIRQNDAHKRFNDSARKLNDEGIKEDDEFNKFVRSLMKSGK